MSIAEATEKLVEVRRKWRNNGSSIEFSKAEGQIYREFFKADPGDWITTEAAWSEAQLEAHKICK